jgi:hypothetical protein
MSELASETPRQIIGIVGDVRDGALNRDPGPAMYIPNAQVPDALNALNVHITPVSRLPTFAPWCRAPHRGSDLTCC